MPKPFILFAVLITRYFPITDGSIKRSMTKMLLEQSQPVTGIVYLNRMDGKRVSQTVRTDTSCLACLWIRQLSQASVLCTIANHWPCLIAADAEEKPLAISQHRSTPVYVVPDYLSGVAIEG